jgi:hypothetical protein
MKFPMIVRDVINLEGPIWRSHVLLRPLTGADVLRLKEPLPGDSALEPVSPEATVSFITTGWTPEPGSAFMVTLSPLSVKT